MYARHTGGKMLFRIEDTDRERYDPRHVDAIINGMKWLELDWDGDKQPVSKYEQRHRHAEVALEMLKRGQAYYCYCTPEELDAMREKAKAEGSNQFYDRRWRDSTATPPEGVKPVIRIKAPLEGTRVVHDQVQGEVTVNAEQLDDMIILRSDGVPTYMLAVVVDDHDMGVTHVIRGDDHLNNTITLDDWWYFLEVLPPRRWERRGISESFYMSEFCTLNITTHLVKVQDRCFMLDDECTKTHDQVVEMCKPRLMQPKPELTNHYAREE